MAASPFRPGSYLANRHMELEEYSSSMDQPIYNLDPSKGLTHFIGVPIHPSGRGSITIDLRRHHLPRHCSPRPQSWLPIAPS